MESMKIESLSDRLNYEGSELAKIFKKDITKYKKQLDLEYISLKAEGQEYTLKILQKLFEKYYDEYYCLKELWLHIHPLFTEFDDKLVERMGELADSKEKEIELYNISTKEQYKKILEMQNDEK